MADLKLGAHKSIAGGLQNAVDRVDEIGGNCLQLFSSSPKSWAPAELEDEDVKVFKKRVESLGISPIYFHAAYLINLGDDSKTGFLSKRSLKAEFNLAEELGVLGSVVHLGSFKDRSKKPAFEHERYPVLIENIQEVLDETPDDILFLAENMGQKKIGKWIEELEKIIKDVGSDRMRVCLDTCHLHSAGYDISSKPKLDKFLEYFDNKIGLERLELWHLNDSKDDFESFRDRHENIGEGNVGIETFEAILNHPECEDFPFVIETPGFDEKGPDKKNLDILKKLVN